MRGSNYWPWGLPPLRTRRAYDGDWGAHLAAQSFGNLWQWLFDRSSPVGQPPPPPRPPPATVALAYIGKITTTQIGSKSYCVVSSRFQNTTLCSLYLMVVRKLTEQSGIVEMQVLITLTRIDMKWLTRQREIVSTGHIWLGLWRCCPTVRLNLITTGCNPSDISISRSVFFLGSCHSKASEKGSATSRVSEALVFAFIHLLIVGKSSWCSFCHKWKVFASTGLCLSYAF